MTLGPSPGIPRIIHQTWRTADVPPSMGYPETWRQFNPDWSYRFWTDDDLLLFFQTMRPDLVDLYLSYSRPVQRADLARYCILQAFGGVYADVDTRCLATLEPLAGDARVVLCEEPPRHWGPAHLRGMERLWFNGTMASPAGHPFWADVITLCRKMADRRDHDVLETTGPLILSAAVDRWPDRSALSLNSCGLFALSDVWGGEDQGGSYGPHGNLRLSNHLWKGSWYERRSEGWPRRKLGRLRWLVDRLTGGPRLDPASVLAALDHKKLVTPLSDTAETPSVMVLMPLRDAEDDLPRSLELLLNLDHPRERLHLCFGHGNSTDETGKLLEEFLQRHGAEFASARVVDLLRNAPRLIRNRRWKRKYQLARRRGIAKARNDLLDFALDGRADWILWIDADLVDYPTNIIAQLLAAGEKIVTPDCVLEPDGPSFDLNAYLDIGAPSRAEFYRHVTDGLLQPPADWWFRRHLHDLRYLDRVPLNGVGGTMLLVQADVHRAGLRFPERPYRHLIETEGFGQMARDAGIVPVGLPQVQVRHTSR